MHPRRNALNAPGFYAGPDSHKRKRSLDAAAWHRSHSEKDLEGVSIHTLLATRVNRPEFIGTVPISLAVPLYCTLAPLS